MPKSNSLYLHEEIMLLSLHDTKGTSASGYDAYAVGGAIVAELLLAGRLRIDEAGKKKFLGVRSDASMGDAVIDKCLNKIVKAKRRATIQTWVGRFAALPNLKHDVALGLCKRGILRADEDKILWLFTRKIYPEIKPEPEDDIISRIRGAILDENDEIEPRTIVLISLAQGSNLLRFACKFNERKAHKKRIEQLVNGEITGKATKDAIAAIQSAVIVACIMPAIMTTIIST